MEIGQWITTFSSRGLDRDGSGNGVYSYSSDMKNMIREGKYPSNITGIPTLKNSTGETAGIPDIMRVDNSERADDIIYISNTHFVGKSYNDTANRGNNYISHGLRIRDINRYPAEFYGSRIFRRGLTPEEDLNPVPLEKLTEAKTVLDREKVQAFLQSGDRIRILCYLLEAVLNRDTINLVIIYDEKENIPLWIAAVQMSLPLKCALDISFCTFCPDPLNYSYDIRGVAKGFEEAEIDIYKEKGQHFIFDMINHDYAEKYPQRYGDEKRKGGSFGDIFGQDYYRMVSLAWSGGSRMDDFFEFIDGFRNYNKANAEIKDAALMYQMTKCGRAGKLDPAGKEAAFSFSEKYGDDQVHISLMKNMLSQLLCEYYNRSKEAGSDSALNGLFDSYQNMYSQGIFQANREKQAELLVELYYLLVMDCDADSADSESKLEILSCHAEQIEQEMADQLVSEEELSGCYRKNAGKEELTKNSMLSELAEICHSRKAFLCLRKLLRYQADGKLKRGLRADFCRSLAGWVKAAERIYGTDESGMKELSSVLGPFEEKYDILSDCNVCLSDSEKDALTKISGYYAAEVLRNRKTDKPADYVRDCFGKYFADSQEKWEFFSPVIEEFLVQIEGKDFKQDTARRELLYLFNTLCGKTDYHLRTESFCNLVRRLADKMVLSDKKLLYSCSKKWIQGGNYIRHAFEHIENYCRINGCYGEDAFRKLRYFAYMYQILNISELKEWRALWEIYRENPVQADFLSDGEQKLHYELLCNMSETTFINFSGYRVLLKGMIWPDSMEQYACRLVCRYFKEASRSVCRSIRSNGTMLNSNDAMLNLLGLLTAAEFHPQFSGILKAEFNRISQKEMDKMKNSVKDICKCRTDIPGTIRKGMRRIWMEYTKDYSPYTFLERFRHKAVRG